MEYQNTIGRNLRARYKKQLEVKDIEILLERFQNIELKRIVITHCECGELNNKKMLQIGKYVGLPV